MKKCIKPRYATLRSWVMYSLFINLMFFSKVSIATIVITGGSWTSNGLPATVTDPDITISGTFIIDVNAKFDNCPAIKMATGTKIVVNDGVTFTADYSHIYTTGNWMWKGISMVGTSTSGGTVKMYTTILEDAEVAINGIDWTVGADQSNFNFDLQFIKFNRNGVSILKGATYGVFLTGATNFVRDFIVSCVDDINATIRVPVNLKGTGYMGLGGSKPVNGFQFQQVENVQIGHLHPVSGYGVFEYLNNGIFARHCTPKIVNCTFNHIRSYASDASLYASHISAFNWGASIFLYFTKWYASSYINYFTPQNIIWGCYFYDTDYGIRSVSSTEMDIRGCTFDNCVEGIDYAYYRNYYGKDKVRIENCDIKNCNLGVLALDNNMSSTQIFNNQISVNFPAVSPFFGITKAISITPSLPSLSGTTLIDGNTITGGEIGLELNMVEGATVSNNIIHFQNFGSLSVGTPAYLRQGIYMFGGKGNDIRANSIKGTAGTYTSGPIYFGSTNEPQYGISTFNSPGNSIVCNNTGDLYTAFHFAGADLNTRLSSNNLEAGYSFVTGIFMQAWGTGSAIISQQGTVGGVPHFNSFNGNFNYPGGYRTVCDASTNGDLSRFLYASGTPATPTPNLGLGFSPITIFGTASTSYASIACVPPLRLTGWGNTGSTEEPIDQLSLQWAFAVAADSLYSSEVFADFLKFQSQSFLYAYLADRPSLRAAYSDLATFYTNSSSTPIAALYSSDSLVRLAGQDTLGIDSILIAAAIAQANSIPYSTPFAGYEAELRVLVLDKIIQGDIEYDSLQKARLSYIASLCPGTAGMGVYMARNLVHSWDRAIVFDDDTTCAGTGGAMMRRLQGKMWTRKGLPAAGEGNNAVQHKMIPNPASRSTQLFLLQGLERNTSIKFYDLSGRTIQSILLPAKSSQITIDISQIPVGMYFYSNEDASIKGKLMVK